MSLGRLALRLATVKALRGRTLAGDMVRDSEIGPIDEAAAQKEIPFVVVYTDDVEVSGTGTDLLAHDGRQCLVIEIGVTTRMKPGRNGWAIPTTDAGMEMTIDVIERQIKLALCDPGNAWAELWRRLVLSIEMRKSQRGASAKEGVRFAGRQIVIDAKLPRDPAPGAAPGPVWAAFAAACAADADLASFAPMFTSLATGGATDWPEWKRVRAAYGLAADRAAALQLVPHPADTAGTAVFEAPELETTAAIADVGQPT